MPLCKRLMELGSDLVFLCADLVSGMVSTLEEDWRRRQLIGEIMTEEVEHTVSSTTVLNSILLSVLDNNDGAVGHERANGTCCSGSCHKDPLRLSII